MAVITHKLKIRKSAIRKIERAKEVALFKTIEALKTDVVQAQVMPFDTGTMQNDSTFVAVSTDKKKAKLITRTPYALRLYYHPEYNFQKTNNPNARGLWLEDWITGAKKDFCAEQYAQFFKKETD